MISHEWSVILYEIITMVIGKTELHSIGDGKNSTIYAVCLLLNVWNFDVQFLVVASINTGQMYLQ